MGTMDRRAMLNHMLLAATGVATVTAGIAAFSSTSEAAPLALGMAGTMRPESFVEEAQLVVVRPRRRRRWSCWWFRVRRVCGWR
jgi:hypothetical protein